MKGSKLLFLLVSAALLAVIAWALHRRDESAWGDRALASDGALLGDLAVNDIALVRVTGPDGRVTLRRGADGWVVGERSDYQADFRKVSALILKLANLRALQDVPVSAGGLGALALRAPGGDTPASEAATLVMLEDGGGADVASLVVGKVHTTTPAGQRADFGAMPTGRYVMNERDPGTAFLVAEAFNDLGASPAAWIDRSFVRPGAPKRVAVAGRDKDHTWTISREAPGGPWQLEGAKGGVAVDSSKLPDVEAMLAGMTVADAPDGPDDARIKALVEAPVAAAVDSFDGLRYNFTIGAGGGDNLPVKVAVQEIDVATPGADGGQPEARGEKLAEARRFEGRVVFIPRSFLEPFLAARPSLPAAAPSPVPSPTPQSKKRR